MPCPELKDCPETPSVTLVSFPDPECAHTKKGSGDNATVSWTLEGHGHDE